MQKRQNWWESVDIRMLARFLRSSKMCTDTYTHSLSLQSKNYIEEKGGGGGQKLNVGTY